MQKERIVILGAGESGTGAALLAKAKGYDVFVSDSGPVEPNSKDQLTKSGIAFEENNHTRSAILNAAKIIKSPGIPESAEIIQEIRSKKIPLVSEVEFAAPFTSARIIAITGTNGKTTTTLLTYHLLSECGFHVGLAGNVGRSLSGQILADGDNEKDYYVLELSSFQLDDTYSLKSHIAILLNITPDHLDRYHHDFGKYCDSKFRILQNMTPEGAFIYWNEDQAIQSRLESLAIQPRKLELSLTHPGSYAYASGSGITVNSKEFLEEDLPLKGKHNQLNMMAAIATTGYVGAEYEQIRKALQKYKNAPHRMELAGIINGVSFINDSKATNVASVYYALDAYEASITWIAGGVDKGNDYNRLKQLVSSKVKALICLGVNNQKLKESFGDILENIVETDDIREAARMGYEYSNKNDVVLLSPACASFDLFRNYEDRGNKFKEAVGALKMKLEVKTNQN